MITENPYIATAHGALLSLVAGFMVPTLGPSGSDPDGPHVGPMNPDSSS